MKKMVFLLIILSALYSCTGQKRTVTFKVDISQTESAKQIGLRGNISPLSWEKDYPLTDENGDGIHEVTIIFETDKKNIRYKFSNAAELELKGSDNRILWFKNAPQNTAHQFNEYNYYDTEKIASLRYTPEQIKEDLAVLRKTVQFIHPNLYRFEDSLAIDAHFKTLETEMLAKPDLLNSFKAISKFAAQIRCSHTFTNPWNQGPAVKKAIFYQPDKIPFTFLRIGKQLFINRNASNNTKLKKGLEILQINAVPTAEIMTRLSQYITSDGTNYEKRLQRLTMDGNNKFELFDIFYPLEFGSTDTFKLQLKNHTTKEVFETSVKAMSKTNRSAILAKRYDDFTSSFAEGWQFKILNEKTAHLKMHSFAIFSTDFKWEAFLIDVFDQLKAKNISNLILDIRGNEGGDNAVVEFILKRLITAKIEVNNAAITTAYRKIPEDIKPHISTWEKRPYNWGKRAKKQANGKYLIKEPMKGKTQTYKPSKNGFRGNTYLITNAENSSATHIMATYFKYFKLGTIVGQETGGSQFGVNGGYIFFHRLPNSRIEIDIPVFGISLFPTDDKTSTGGILPDFKIEKNIDDFINEVDTELESVLQLIK